VAKPQRLAPKGLGEAEAAAALLSRGRHEPAVEPEPAPAPEPEAPKRAKPAAAPTADTPSRNNTDGMKRRTYYLATADIDAFETAADRIHTALGGLVPKHRILGALIADGVNNVDAIRDRLKAELVAGLG
jgi:hypothetical protein